MLLHVFSFRFPIIMERKKSLKYIDHLAVLLFPACTMTLKARQFISPKENSR